LFGVFGLKVRCVRLGLGDESIELQQFMAAPGRPLPADFHANDRWFQHVAIVVRDMDRAYASLREQNVSFASTAPQLLPAWNPNAGGISAFYFKDPDGNHLELIHFPAGKGQARWQYNTDLFMGIDHTAIVVADTEASLAFYRDLLGLEVAGTSENYGPEQEHLNNVFGAHLRITALRAAAGPGVELLEYLAPRTGRAYPSDTLASDRWHWQINMRANLHKASILTAPGKKIAWVSSYPIDLTDQALGYGRAFMIRDPDGHATNLEQQ